MMDAIQSILYLCCHTPSPIMETNKERLFLGLLSLNISKSSRSIRVHHQFRWWMDIQRKITDEEGKKVKQLRGVEAATFLIQIDLPRPNIINKNKISDPCITDKNCRMSLVHRSD